MAAAEPRAGVPETGELLLQRTHGGGFPYLRRVVDKRYVVQAPLHQGGRDALWSAWDLDQGRLVALKLFHPSVWATEEGRNAVVQHATRVAQVKHAHVLDLDRAGRCPQTGLVYLSLELCVEYREGLRQAARDAVVTQSADPHEAVGWVMQAAEGLQAAHAQGVTHNRLRLAAILVRPQTRRAQLAGFGPPPSSVSLAGGCAAPDAQQDLRDLGGLLYEMLTGKSAAADCSLAGTPRALARAIEQRWPGRPAHNAHHLWRIVRRATAADSDGYPSCAALAADLRRYLGDPQRRAAAARRRRRLRALVASALLLALAAGIAWLLPRVFELHDRLEKLERAALRLQSQGAESEVFERQAQHLRAGAAAIVPRTTRAGGDAGRDT